MSIPTSSSSSSFPNPSSVLVTGTSCDTFVVLSDVTKSKKNVIFGKNSDRPNGEVQEVVFVKGAVQNDPKQSILKVFLDILINYVMLTNSVIKTGYITYLYREYTHTH